MVECSPEEFPNFGNGSDQVESSLSRMELNSKLDFFLFDSKISNNSSPQIKFIKKLFLYYYFNLFILNRFEAILVQPLYINYDILPMTIHYSLIKTRVPYRTSDVVMNFWRFLLDLESKWSWKIRLGYIYRHLT